jgi:hypothetical protein
VGWSADSGDITADSTFALADGSFAPPASSLQYIALITSEHRKPQFSALIGVLTGAVGDTMAVILSMPGLFDLDVAVGVQLDTLGLWVGQARLVPEVLTPGFFGFADDSAALGFGELTNPTVGGVFYEQGETFETTTTLSDNDYRTIIRARIVRNQSNGTLSAIENALQYIFGVPCSVADIGTMSLALQISAPITATERALLSTLDILPRPAGVAIGSITYSPD